MHIEHRFLNRRICRHSCRHPVAR